MPWKFHWIFHASDAFIQAFWIINVQHNINPLVCLYHVYWLSLYATIKSEWIIRPGLLT